MEVAPIDDDNTKSQVDRFRDYLFSRNNHNEEVAPEQGEVSMTSSTGGGEEEGGVAQGSTSIDDDNIVIVGEEVAPIVGEEIISHNKHNEEVAPEQGGVAMEVAPIDDDNTKSQAGPVDRFRDNLLAVFAELFKRIKLMISEMKDMLETFLLFFGAYEFTTILTTIA